MIIGVLKENTPGEKRVAIIPDSITKLSKLENIELLVEANIGETIQVSDDIYKKAGATICDKKKILSSSDIVLKCRKPSSEEISKLKKDSIHISFLDPFNSPETIKEFSKANISAISLEMIPRSTIAQKMDALSSQANIAGYIAVLLAAEKTSKILPMMMTPAGTINPARVFIIGAGVAGLQAIATAKRLGARVEAFDTRDVVEEQVQSLGAKFIKIDLGETGQTKDGYAKALTEEQLKMQREGMAKVCSHSDIVITTAQLFGRKAPRIITKDMINRMQPGSVIVDMAIESGGNVEGAELDKEVKTENGVHIIGLGNLPSKAATASSQMLSNNLTNFIQHFWDKENKTFNLNLEDDILSNCVITHNGEIINKLVKEKLGV